jgi:hypothetical protein
MVAAINERFVLDEWSKFTTIVAEKGSYDFKE